MFSNKKLLFLATPAVLYTAFYFIYPTITLVISSFTGGDTLISNYQYVLSDPYYIQSILNSVVYGFGISLFGITASVAVAILMYSISGSRVQKTLQLSTYTPYLLSWVVIFGIWNAIFQPSGLMNILLINLGVIDIPIQFWASGIFSKIAIIIMTVWKDLGYNALIFYIALLSIPTSLIEAVSLEKDTVSNKVKSVYIPHIRSTILVMFMLIFVGALKTFDSAYIVSNSINKEFVQTPAVYAYESGVIEGNTHIADASSMIFLVICLILLVLVRKGTEKYE